MLPQTFTDLAAWAFALFGMACLAVWPLFRTQRTMLSLQLSAVGGLSLHYALQGVATAATVNALGAIQIAVSLLCGSRPGLRWIGYALAVAMVASSIVTWQGAVSVLSATGMALVAIGRMQQNPAAMRLIVVAGGPFWLAHDLIIASPIAIADAASLGVGLWQILKQDLRWGRRARTVQTNAAPARFASASSDYVSETTHLTPRLGQA
jgi:inner membrane protein